MKKILFLLVFVLLFISVAGCTNGEEEMNTTATKNVTSSPKKTEDKYNYPEEKSGELYDLEMSDYKSGLSVSETIKALARGEKRTIVAYGTSLTQLTGWVSAFSEIMEFKYEDNAKIINSAATAMDSNWGVSNVADKVVSRSPDMVFIEFSINDAFLERNISLEKSKSNLLEMTNKIKLMNPDCEIVIMTMDIPLDTHFTTRPEIEKYYEVYRNTAQEKNFIFVDNFITWKAILDESESEYRKLVSDGIHPTAAGHQKVTLVNILDVLYSK